MLTDEQLADGCPKCGSKRPNLHPATALGGEVFVCPDDYHLQSTDERNLFTKLAHLPYKMETPDAD